ncbi:MAG: leucine-rich repeat protein [Bacteroidaceae bacterium]|nr:leucine-rich repeat protein [Bacteroidaceae bacterium]
MKLKQLFLCLLALLVSTMTRAYDFSVNGLYYNITGTNTVEVTYVEDGEGNGDFYYDAITIPKRVSNNNTTYNVTRIGYDAFIDCSGLTSITIPEGVTSIGEAAFYYCTGLTSINIPSGVTSIGVQAFDSCSGLTSINIPSSVTIIGIGAFMGCYGLTSITISEGVTSIGGNAFSGCSGLTSINIPSSVTSIGNYAFSSCPGLTSISVDPGNSKYDSRGGCNAIIETSSNTLIAGCQNTIIPSSVTAIEDSAFNNCTGLTSISIPSSVTSIGELAFKNCNGLTNITIPSSVTSIGNWAFEYCSGLTSITIPSSVTSIGYTAFRHCSGLTSISVESGNSKYDSRGGCNAIIETSSNTLIAGCQNTVIPYGVTSIGVAAFYNCNGLTNINIPSSVTSIGNQAFENCYGLKTVLIPSSVTSIGASAFSTPNLSSVTIMASEPMNISEDVFEDAMVGWGNENATLYVPAGSKAKYQAAAGWNKFPTITEFSLTNHLDAVKVPTTAGSKVRLPISLTDEGNTIGVQFDLLLPQGFTIPTVDSEGHVNITMGDRSNGHTATGSKVADGHYSFAIINTQNRALKGTEGTVAYIEINVDQNVGIADYDILITDAKLSVKSGTNQTGIVLANTPATLTVTDVTPGDVNGDGDIDIVDVTSTIGHIIHQTPSNFILKAADVNNDGDVDIVDVTTIIDMIINKGRNVKEFRNRVESLDPQ